MNSVKNVVILQSQVPFSRGGAELLNERLCKEFLHKGISAEIVSLPFIYNKKEDLIKNSLDWLNFDISVVSGREIDLVICNKFPTYLVKHKRKIVWLVHQHRQAYDLLGTRFGDLSCSCDDETIRNAIANLDLKSLKACKKVFAISRNVADRLHDFCGISSEVLEPPLPWDVKETKFVPHQGNYILVVGRICSSKRIENIIRAIPNINKKLSLFIVGREDEPGCLDFLNSEVLKHQIHDRVEFKGAVSQSELQDLYANSFAVYYGSFDEDYGFVSFEAALYQKPLIALTDSGYITDVIKEFENGVLSSPSPDSISDAVNVLYEDQQMYKLLANNTKKVKIDHSWSDIVDKFISLEY